MLYVFNSPQHLSKMFLALLKSWKLLDKVCCFDSGDNYLSYNAICIQIFEL